MLLKNTYSTFKIFLHCIFVQINAVLVRIKDFQIHKKNRIDLKLSMVVSPSQFLMDKIKSHPTFVFYSISCFTWKCHIMEKKWAANAVSF